MPNNLVTYRATVIYSDPKISHMHMCIEERRSLSPKLSQEQIYSMLFKRATYVLLKNGGLDDPSKQSVRLEIIKTEKYDQREHDPIHDDREEAEDIQDSNPMSYRGRMGGEY